jgi:uncharacterized protein (TIGR02646 family)
MAVDSWYLNITELPKISNISVEYIESLLPHRASQWDLQTNEMKAYKKELLDKLKEIQNNRCVYCGLGLERKSVDREHFVHKAAKRGYEEFIFVPENLFASCEFCNRKLKNQLNVIDVYDENYDHCTFKIVHPFIDSSSDFISFLPSNDHPFKVLPTDNDCGKGRRAIEIFELDTIPMWKLRQSYLTQMELSQSDFKEILAYKTSLN